MFWNNMVNYSEEIKDKIREEILIAENLSDITKDIIIVVKDQLDLIRNCIESIKKTTSNFNIFLWDNNSNDETKLYLKSLVDKNIFLFSSSENVGFIEPNNVLFSKGDSPMVVLLNSDTYAMQYWDKVLLHYLRTQYSLVGYQGGSLDENMFGNNYLMGDKIDYVCGWCMSFFRKTITTNTLFDPNLCFAYGEDSDLSLSIIENGGKIMSAYSGLVFHLGSSTAKSLPEEEKQKMRLNFVKNHDYLVKKWGSKLLYLRDLQRGVIDIRQEMI